MKRKIYLDHNATTPLREEVRQAIQPYLETAFGNPSSIHGAGREVRCGVDRARQQVAGLLNAKPETIFFTSGGTEADNLAIKGAARFLKSKGKGNHLITSAIEHDAVLRTCRYLEKYEGFELTVLPVDSSGQVELIDVIKSIRKETILASIMMANNEIGTIQPIEEIGAVLKQQNILFHVDAVQAMNFLKVDLQKMPIDLLSLSGHKIGALKGIGALYVREGIHLWPLIHGGHQEKTLRSGTENVVGIVSLGAAAELVSKERAQKATQTKKLRNQLWQGLRSRIEGVHLNGHPTDTLPGTLNVSFEGAEGESILLALDLEGIAASSGSACSSGSVEQSHVLQAIQIREDLARNTVRFSLGCCNTAQQIDHVLEVLPGIISRIRCASPSLV